ncbi:MAG: hypothetical protein AB7E21_18115, partial [Pseudodonghicola sp.]
TGARVGDGGRALPCAGFARGGRRDRSPQDRAFRGFHGLVSAGSEAAKGQESAKTGRPVAPVDYGDDIGRRQVFLSLAGILHARSALKKDMK